MEPIKHLYMYFPVPNPTLIITSLYYFAKYNAPSHCSFNIEQTCRKTVITLHIQCSRTGVNCSNTVVRHTLVGASVRSFHIRYGQLLST